MAENKISKWPRPKLEAEYEVLRRASHAHGLSSVFRSLIKWGAIAFASVQARIAIVAMAGQETIVTLVARFFADVDVSHKLSWTVSGLALLYAAAQRRLRLRQVERYGPLIRAAEQEVDPKRSSSRLTSRGETNPMDKE